MPSTLYSIWVKKTHYPYFANEYFFMISFAPHFIAKKKTYSYDRACISRQRVIIHPSPSSGWFLKALVCSSNLPEWTDLLSARTGPGSHIAGVKMLPDKRYLRRSRSSKVDKYFFNPQSPLNCVIESVWKICQLASHSSKRPIEQTQPFDTIVFTYFSALACTREMVRSCCFILKSEKMIENRTRWKYNLSNIISKLDRD